MIFVGCDLYKQNEYRQYYVIESYLYANSPLSSVRVSTTSPIEEEYDFQKNAVSGAEVLVHKLNADSSIAETYLYQEIQPGYYAYYNDDVTVSDNHLYKLQVTATDGQVVTSITYVPGDFETVNTLRDSYEYQSTEQVEIEATPSSYITDRQAYYIFTVRVIHPKKSNLTPFYLDLVLNEGNDMGSYEVNSSGVLNEANFSRTEAGNIILKVPWLAIAFYDSNDVMINAIDNNLYNFIRSQSVQTGGISLSPGQIQNIRYNVNGGIGIFGSMARETNRVFITKPPE